MRAANIKRFAGRTAVGCIAGKQKSPGFSPLGLLGKRLVNKNRVRSGIYVQQMFKIQERGQGELFPSRDKSVTDTKVETEV